MHFVCFLEIEAGLPQADGGMSAAHAKSIRKRGRWGAGGEKAQATSAGQRADGHVCRAQSVLWPRACASHCSVTNHPDVLWLKTISIYGIAQLRGCRGSVPGGSDSVSLAVWTRGWSPAPTGARPLASSRVSDPRASRGRRTSFTINSGSHTLASSKYPSGGAGQPSLSEEVHQCQRQGRWRSVIRRACGAAGLSPWLPRPGPWS